MQHYKLSKTDSSPPPPELSVDERNTYGAVPADWGRVDSRWRKSCSSPHMEHLPCLNEGGYQLKRKCLRFVDGFVEERYKVSVSRASVCKGFAYVFLFAVWALINIAQTVSDFQNKENDRTQQSQECAKQVVCTGWILIATASFIPIIPPTVSYEAGSRLTEVFFGIFAMVQLVLMSTMANTAVASHVCGVVDTSQPPNSMNAARHANTMVLINQLLILIFLGSSTDMRFAVFLGPLTTFLACGIANSIYTAATNDLKVLFAATRICLFYLVFSACFYFGLEPMEKQRRATFVTSLFQNNSDVQAVARKYQVEYELYEKFTIAEEVAGIEQALQEVFGPPAVAVSPKKVRVDAPHHDVMAYIESQMKCAVLTSRKRSKIIDDIISRAFDENYSVVQFGHQVNEAFPELALYRVPGQTSSGRGMDAELERTRGAFFAIFWILREHMDGRFGFCFGADETGKVYFRRTDEDDEEPVAVGKAPSLRTPPKPPPQTIVKPPPVRNEVAGPLPVSPPAPCASSPTDAANPHLASNSVHRRSLTVSTMALPPEDLTILSGGAASTVTRLPRSLTQSPNYPTNGSLESSRANATVDFQSTPKEKLPLASSGPSTPQDDKKRISSLSLTASMNWRFRTGRDKQASNEISDTATPSSPSNARPAFRPIKSDFPSPAPAPESGGAYAGQASDPAFNRKYPGRKPKKDHAVYRDNSKNNVEVTREKSLRSSAGERSYPLSEKKSFFSMTKTEKREHFFNHMPWTEMRHLLFDAGILLNDNMLDRRRMRTLLVLTAIHDICKIEKLWPAIAPEHSPFQGYLDGDIIGDHDVALAYILTHYPHLLPSFHDGLSHEEQQLVLFTQSKMGFNHGWLVQGESPPGPLFHTFKTLIDAQGVSSQDVAFYFVHWLTDLAGAEPTPMRGSEKFALKFPYQVLRQFINSFPFIHCLSDKSETAVYEEYLQYTWKELQAADPLVFHDVFYTGEAIALFRLLLHAQRNAVHVFQAFKALSAAHRRLLGEEMSMTGIVGQHYSCCESRSGPCILAYYAPAFLQKNADSCENAFLCLEALLEVYRQGRILFESHYNEVGSPKEGDSTFVTVRLDKLKEATLKDIVVRPGAESGADACWVIAKSSTKEAVVELVEMEVLNSWSAEGRVFRFLSFPKAPYRFDTSRDFVL